MFSAKTVTSTALPHSIAYAPNGTTTPGLFLFGLHHLANTEWSTVQHWQASNCARHSDCALAAL